MAGGFVFTSKDRARPRQDILLMVSGFRSIGDIDYAIGRDMFTGRDVRVVLSKHRRYRQRRTIGELAEKVKIGGTLFFRQAELNGSGSFEALDGRVIARHSGERVVVNNGQWARVGAPYSKDMEKGIYGQGLQILFAESAVRCVGRRQVETEILRTLVDDGTGRPGAVIRAVQADGGAFAVRVNADWREGDDAYRSARDSLNAFLVSDVYVSGLEGGQDVYSGNDFLALADDLSGGDYLWEVIPMQSMSFASSYATCVADGSWRDPSAGYRVNRQMASSGWLPSLFVGVSVHGCCYPRYIAPLECWKPVPLAYVPSPGFSLDVTNFDAGVVEQEGDATAVVDYGQTLKRLAHSIAMAFDADADVAADEIALAIEGLQGFDPDFLDFGDHVVEGVGEVENPEPTGFGARF